MTFLAVSFFLFLFGPFCSVICFSYIYLKFPIYLFRGIDTFSGGATVLKCFIPSVSEPQVDFQNPGHTLLPTFPSFMPCGHCGRSLLTK